MEKVYQTLRFGALKIQEKDILHLPEGMLGFPDCRHYILLEDPAQAPFQWLQSLDNTDLSFVLVDPLFIKPDYQIQVSEHEVQALNLESAAQALVFVILSVPEDLSRTTANLKGPIVINPENQRGKQLVLMDDRYSTKYSFLQSLPEDQSDTAEGQGTEGNSGTKTT